VNASGGSEVKFPSNAHVRNLAGSLGNTPVDRELAANRTFLVVFADELLHAQAKPTPQLVAATQTGAVPPVAVTSSAASQSVTTVANNASRGSRPRDSAVVTLTQPGATHSP